ncbi:VWA domain-containing protein [Caldisphaera sp.]|uniref:vWA domain-containing protein n=1 Tax=Caldisphaera sp. TaxID=2060322 RepID=UPI0025BBDEE1|nr:VWA domain-containing protein [Caldisphaera sp.]
MEKQNKRKESVYREIGNIDELRLYRGEKILATAKDLSGKNLDPRISPYLGIDLFYTYYFPIPSTDETSPEDDEEEAFRRTVISTLLKTESAWKTKIYTSADSVTSIVAAASFIEKLNKLLPPNQGGDKGKEGNSQNESDNEGNNSQELQNAIQKASESAMKDAEMAKEVKMLAEKMGAGKGSIFSLEGSAEEILKLARETDVARILEKIEGLKMITNAKTKNTINYSKGWISGIEIGGDIERVHYSQLAFPSLLFYAEFANDRLLLYEKNLPSNKGPIYVLLDKSGSMVGSKIDWARAVAVALFKKAMDEGRNFFVRFFDSVPYQPMNVKSNAKASDILNVLSYLARIKAGGGTDITRAISSAVDDMDKTKTSSKDKPSDIVLITDGEDRLSPEIINKLLKKSNSRLHSVMIQGHNAFLQQISYRYLSVKKLEQKEALEVADFS